MELNALESSKLLALMVAGGAFALAGLWLMFRPKPEGSAAKLELLGMKFESSSAGLLVFLIGAAFLATPLMVAEKSVVEGGAVAGSQADQGAVAIKGPADDDTRANTNIGEPEAKNILTGSPAVILPASAGADEQEPNNFLTEANQIEPGVFYAGQTHRDENDGEDWYVLPTPNLTNETVHFQVRTRKAFISSYCSVSVLDDNEELIKSWKMADVGSSVHTEVVVPDSEFLLVMVHSSNPYFCEYELKAGKV